MTHVENLELTYFGDPILDKLNHHDQNGEIHLPGSFTFNHGWRLLHPCVRCGSGVSLEYDFNSRTRTFDFTRGPDSSWIPILHLNLLSDVFPSLDVVKFEERYVLHRRGFNYQFDFQKKLSESFVNYSCSNCSLVYIASMFMNMPIAPDKNIPGGAVGKTEIDTILGLAEEDELFQYFSTHKTP